MVENILKGKSKDVIGNILVSDLKALGEKKFEIKITPQAKEIISNYGEKFPYNHFKTWFLKNKMIVAGSHLQEYLAVEDGFTQGIK